MRKIPRPFIRMVIACIFFLSAVALNILLPRYWHNIPEIVKHLLLVFSAIMCVHIMEYAYLWWEIFGHIRSILKETLQATHQLIDDNRNSLEKSLQTTNQLISAAANCGLTNLYCSRKDVRGDIYDAVENAEKRVWLLGITFSENVHLDELLSTLSGKIAGGLDIKILLLDVFRDTAVFRTFLESTAPEAAKIINTDRSITHPADPFFHQRLYSDFTHAFDRIRNYPDVEPAVRFYTHNPTCWMMIVDNTVHFQPYTFGRSANQHSSNLCVGANMPVFKFQMQPNGRPFEILEDHFMKLWLTSNVDLFHIEARIADRNRIVKDIFNSHASWFKHVFEVLHTQKNNMPSAIDRRKFPRQPCEWKQPSLNVCSEDCKTIIGASICDYARESISLKTEGHFPLNVGQIVILQGTPPAEPLEANFIIDYFLRIKRFMIKRIVDGPQQIIGLQAIPENGKYNEQNQIDSIVTQSPSLT
ncbi:MAG: hypothetical protein HUU08_00075 [Candidatus Brocadia sp.]|nr:hypothetical protein [Candidatus Brocadia sp.]